ncbi:hypothetical protein BZA05DRAFT_394883, partial [Tricharina praecox]|uniref:uncharacterized protein n=1 Tax=Tricharina praecox TaxID=43433 RepID=UPI00221E7740
IFIQLNTRLCSCQYRQLHSTILLTSRKNNASVDHDERPSIGLSAATNHLPIRPGHLSRVHQLRSNLHQGSGNSSSQSLHVGLPLQPHSFQSQTKSNSRLTLDPIPSRTTGRTTSSSADRSNSITGRCNSITDRSNSSTGRSSTCTGHSFTCTGCTLMLSRTTSRTTNLNSSCPSSSRSPEKCQAGRETSA